MLFFYERGDLQAKVLWLLEDYITSMRIKSPFICLRKDRGCQKEKDFGARPNPVLPNYISNDKTLTHSEPQLSEMKNRYSILPLL